MKYFYLGANLRRLIGAISWPKLDVYEQWKTAFLSAFKDATKGMRYTELLSLISGSGDDTYSYDTKRATTLPAHIHRQLIPLIIPPTPTTANPSAILTDNKLKKNLSAVGQYVSDVSKGGVTFATTTSSKRNCFVMFSSSKRLRNEAPMRAGRIEEIFYHRRGKRGRDIVEPFLVVKEYQHLRRQHQHLDPFANFPDLGTHMYYNDFQPKVRVIRLSDVVSHFAAFVYTPDKMEVECMVARSLARVQFLLTMILKRTDCIVNRIDHS